MSKISLIIPLMFYRVGFTSDWDVLYMGDVRVQCLLIGLGFDLVGYLLMSLPYLFMWDFTDEKHAHVMEVLKQRAEKGNDTAERASGELQDAAVNAEATAVTQKE